MDKRMTYATGTINNANPGPTLYTALETTLIAAGYTLVDTVVIGARTHKVLKSEAASNSYALDWYLNIHYPTTGAGSIFFTPFESFDPATDLAYRGPYTAASTTIDPTTYSRYGATGYTLETNWQNTGSATGYDNPLSTSAFNYYFTATPDRTIFASTVVPGEMHYAGFFTPTAEHAAHAGAAMFPLITAHFATASTTSQSSSSSTSCSASLTRMPKFTTASWQSNVIIDIPYARMSGQVGALGASGGSGQITVARKPVTMGVSGLNATSASIYSPGLVGYLSDVGNTWTDGTIVRGDTLLDNNGDTWVGIEDSSNVGLWFRAV